MEFGVFIAAGYGAIPKSAQIDHPRKAACLLALQTAYMNFTPPAPQNRPLAGFVKKVVF
jgi:hypothetical protein